MTLSVWLAFLVASFVISLSPGAGAVYAMSCGMRGGYRHALIGIVGMQFGLALQLVVVAVGLGAVLATSTLAFNVVKWAGVAYLVWLGWQQFRAEPRAMSVDGSVPETSSREAFVRGFLVNASNPKATVFFLAVVPPFIDPARPLAAQYLAVMGTLAFTDLIVMSGYALLAARVLRLLREPHHIRWMNRTFGGLFMLAGGLLATFKRGA
jgi:homoserine/homoserine lactone efflux protein